MPILFESSWDDEEELERRNRMSFFVLRLLSFCDWNILFNV
jgi:hypothetical protein